jgi:hypothetical protein
MWVPHELELYLPLARATDAGCADILAALVILAHGAVDGRVSPGWDTALVVPVVDHAAVVGHVNAGYDLGGHGDGAFRGGAFIGARFSL